MKTFPGVSIFADSVSDCEHYQSSFFPEKYQISSKETACESCVSLGFVSLSPFLPPFLPFLPFLPSLSLSLSLLASFTFYISGIIQYSTENESIVFLPRVSVGTPVPSVFPLCSQIVDVIIRIAKRRTQLIFAQGRRVAPSALRKKRIFDGSRVNDEPHFRESARSIHTNLARLSLA